MVFRKSYLLGLFVLISILFATTCIAEAFLGWGDNDSIPCWVENMPEDCNEYKKEKDEYLFFKAGIIQDSKSKKLNDEQKKALMTSLRGELIETLETKIKSDVSVTQECKGISETGKISCDTVVKEYIKASAKGKVLPNDIKLEHFYYKELDDNKWELSGLGKVAKSYYEQRLDSIQKGIKAEFRNLAQSKPEETEQESNNEKQEIKSKETSRNDIIWLREYDCDDIIFKDFKDDSLPVNTLSSELEKMTGSLKSNGIYTDSRVLETNSEIFKAGKGLTDYEIDKFEGITENKIENISRCYKREADQAISYYFEREVELLKRFNTQHISLAEFNTLIAEWRNLVKQIEQHKTELQVFNQIYEQRLKLLSHTYMAFTYANSRRKNLNIKAMEKYADDIVKNRLKKEKAEHFISKQSRIKDGFANIVIHDFSGVEIQKSTSDSIAFRPRSGRRAHVQTYRMTQLSESKKGNFKNFSINLPKYIEPISGANIILGIDDVKVKSDYKCSNCYKLKEHAYNRLSKFAENQGIDISGQKEKIKNLIIEVIQDNYDMVRRYHKLKDEFTSYNHEKNQKIQEYKTWVAHRDERLREILKKILGKTLSEQILPSEAKDYEKEQIDNLLRTYESKINIEIGKTYKDMTMHRQNKEIMIFSIIDKTEELNIDYLKERLIEKYQSFLKTCCPSQHTETTDIVNYSDVKTKEYTYRVDPKIIGYNLPFLRIKSLENTNSVRYSLGVALKVSCQQLREDYLYSPQTRELVDMNTNVRWEIPQENKMARKRASEKAEFETVDYNEYRDFCNGYTAFIKERQKIPYFKDWPRIRCLNLFEYDSYNNTIIDNVRKEEWKIMDKMSFWQLRSQIRGTGWLFQPYKKAEDFFLNLKKENKNGNLDPYIINLIANKKFWTNTKAGQKLETIIFDGDKIDWSSEQKANEDIYGLVLKRF